MSKILRNNFKNGILKETELGIAACHKIDKTLNLCEKNKLQKTMYTTSSFIKKWKKNLAKFNNVLF